MKEIKDIASSTHSRYSWLMTGVAFVFFFIITGLTRCFAIFYTELLDKFDSSATATGWLIGAQSLLRYGLGPLASILCKRFSIRSVIIAGGFLVFIGYSSCGQITNIVWMYATFSVVVGVGASFVYGPSIILLGYYFAHGRKALAYGIAFSGMGFGIFVIPLVYTYLRHYFGFEGTLLLLGGVSFHIVPLGILCVEPSARRSVNREQHHNKPASASINVQLTVKLENAADKTSRMSLLEKCQMQSQQGKEISKKDKLTSCMGWSVLKNFHVLVVCLFAIAYCVAVSSHYAYCGALLQQNGLNAQEISYLLSVSGIFDVAGNIILGVLFDIPFVRKRSTLCFCFVNMLFAVVILIIPFLETFSTLCAVFAFWGVLCACNTTKNVLLCDNVEKDQLPDAVGMSLVAMAIGYGGGPFFTGIFVDAFGNYALPFFVPGGFLTVLSLAVCVLSFIRGQMMSSRSKDSRSNV